MKDSAAQVVDAFTDAMYSVKETQQWLLLTASHLRLAIASGEADARLQPMVEYLELQGGRLRDFVRGLHEVPHIEPATPEVNVKQPIDPKAN